MNFVRYGGGTNSTAMLIWMYRKGIPINLTLFADTGCEQPHTSEYLPKMNGWPKEHGLPEITMVTDQNGDRPTLEQECLRSGTLPAIVYGYKKYSLKHKVAPQDKLCNNHAVCQAIWEQGEKVVKFIGYDAGEEQRHTHAFAFDTQDKNL